MLPDEPLTPYQFAELSSRCPFTLADAATALNTTLREAFATPEGLSALLEFQASVATSWVQNLLDAAEVVLADQPLNQDGSVIVQGTPQT